MRYGLLGEKLGHSHSPAVHALLAPYRYKLYEVPACDVATFIRQEDIGGLNVTIPYKRTVVPLCDALSPLAGRLGSVNTLVYGPDRKITGHNTDYDGFVQMVRRAGIVLKEKKVLLLGSGGTSRTARCAALDLGAREVVVVSREGENNYRNLGLHADSDILINTTPVGMYPKCGGAPVDLDAFPKLTGVVDVIYNPLRTRLVQRARALGISATGGLPMLVFQAAAAAQLFCGDTIPPEKAEEALRSLQRSLENIVLIGMPGSGKTCVGREVARLTGRELVDTDGMIQRAAGKSIPDIFAEDGERVFRALEREAVASAASRGGCVIATGGGAVLLAENRVALSQNSRIYLLKRPVDQLATQGRPLSKDLSEMERARMPLYMAVADAVFDNTGSILAAAERILEDFYENTGD